MAHRQGNGRNVAMPDENRPSWRPQDVEVTARNRRSMDDDDDRYWADRRFRDDRVRDWGARGMDERYGRGMDYGREGYGMDDRYGRDPDLDERFRRDWRERMPMSRSRDWDRGREWGDRSGRDFGRERDYEDRGGWSDDRGYYPERYGAQGGYGDRGFEYSGHESERFLAQGGQQMGFEESRDLYGHRGKGPKGYMRSDERVRELVCDMLTDNDRIDASNIEVSVKNGEVTLSGTVEDRRMKRIAEDIALNISGVKDIQNQIRVGDKQTLAGKENESQTQDKRHRA